MLAHRAGMPDRSIQRKNLLEQDKSASSNLYWLLLDFGH